MVDMTRLLLSSECLSTYNKVKTTFLVACGADGIVTWEKLCFITMDFILNVEKQQFYTLIILRRYQFTFIYHCSYMKAKTSLASRLFDVSASVPMMMALPSIIIWNCIQFIYFETVSLQMTECYWPQQTGLEMSLWLKTGK